MLKDDLCHRTLEFHEYICRARRKNRIYHEVCLGRNVTAKISQFPNGLCIVKHAFPDGVIDRVEWLFWDI